ncbi:lebercilin [Tachysurus ichikawai]
MREIDMGAQAQDSSFFHEEKESTCTPPRNENNQDLDLTFGSYVPSIGKPAPRAVWPGSYGYYKTPSDDIEEVML